MKKGLLAVLVLLMAALAGSAWLAYRQLDESAAELRTLYEDRLLAAEQLRQLEDGLQHRFPLLVSELIEGRLSLPQAQHELAHVLEQSHKDWADYRATYLVDAEQQLVPPTDKALSAAWAEEPAVLAQLAAAASPADAQRILLLAQMGRESVLSLLDQLSGIQPEAARQVLQDAAASRVRTVTRLGVLIGVSVLVAALLTWRLACHYEETQAQWRRRQERQQALYAALSASNQLLIRMPGTREVFRGVCDICVRTGHAEVAVVILREGEDVTRVAGAGPCETLFKELPERWKLAEPPTRFLTANRVILSGKSVQIASVDASIQLPDWRRSLMDMGLQSLGAFPIRRAGQCIGALTLYSKEPDFFDEEVCRLLDELVDDMSFAFDVLDTQQAAALSQDHARRMEELFRRLFQHLPVTVVVSDLQARTVVEINETACRRYGVTREEVLGRALPELGVGPTPAFRAEYYRRIETDGEVRAMEIEGTNREGIPFHSLVYGQVIDYLGKRCMLTSSVDITTLKAAQEELRQREAAAAANKAKTAFVTQMSHELRTPLNAVLGLTQLLRERAHARLTPEERSWVGHIHGAGWFLLSLVNDVLDLSRIELGRFDVTLEPVRLEPVLQEALALALATGNPKNARCELKPMSATLATRADRRRLQQVLVNMVTNALKYNREGGSVVLDAQPAEDGVRVCVVDTGAGMTAAQLAQLFQPFNRLGQEFSGVEGTGIGLALSRELVELMHGRLEVSSEPGVGTTVTLTLPLDEAQDLEDPAPTGATRQVPRNARGKVLYIEDNDVNALIVQQALKAFPDVSFMRTANGAEGIAACEKDRPDLVLLDMQLPDMEGVAVLRELQTRQALSKVPIVALSASAMPDDVEAAMNAGATDYWTKPLEFGPFLSGVSRLLNRA